MSVVISYYLLLQSMELKKCYSCKLNSNEKALCDQNLEVPYHGCLGLSGFPFLLLHQPFGALLLEVVESLEVRLVEKEFEASPVKVKPSLAGTVQVSQGPVGVAEEGERGRDNRFLLVLKHHRETLEMPRSGL